MQMKAELDMYEEIIKAITYDDPKYLTALNFDKEAIAKILAPKNTNKLLNEITPKRDKYRALIENIDERIIEKIG